MLFLYFSSSILHNSVLIYFQDQSNEYSLCSLPFMETESSSEAESQKKNTAENYEEFTVSEKIEYQFHLPENNLYFFIKEDALNNQVKEYPTPPPKQFIKPV